MKPQRYQDISRTILFSCKISKVTHKISVEKRSVRFGWPNSSQLVVTKVCVWFDFNSVLRRWGHPSNYVQLDEFYLSFLRDGHTAISQGLAEAERLNGIQSPHVSIIFMAGFYAGSLVTRCMCDTENHSQCQEWLSVVYVGLHVCF